MHYMQGAVRCLFCSKLVAAIRKCCKAFFLPIFVGFCKRYVLKIVDIGFEFIF